MPSAGTGRYDVLIDASDIGTGAWTALTQIAADALEVSVDCIRLQIGDSALPPGGGAGGAMGTASWGTAVVDASLRLRQRLNDEFDDVVPLEGLEVSGAFVIGSSLNAGFISGSPRYNYGKNSWYIPQRYIDRRDKLQAVAAEFGMDLRTAALRFSSAPDVVAALVVGARSADQIVPM
ncbi:MAG TPA: molybdopterin cofactor-binding domain-containing protein [Chloroflexota bacterium]|nr:molybdopterin cofactor-binding domain-containing protein [Chloroflexota bacterium]